jgi:hypothetical protein
MKIGVIGDDFTVCGDIANTLAKAGARNENQYLGRFSLSMLYRMQYRRKHRIGPVVN